MPVFLTARQDYDVPDFATTDFQMFRHAARVTGKSADETLFRTGYARGEFHFSEDPRLIGELLSLHELNLHRIAGEWLVFRDGKAVYGSTPGEAICKWVVSHT